MLDKILSRNDRTPLVFCSWVGESLNKYKFRFIPVFALGIISILLYQNCGLGMGSMGADSSLGSLSVGGPDSNTPPGPTPSPDPNLPGGSPTPSPTPYVFQNKWRSTSAPADFRVNACDHAQEAIVYNGKFYFFGLSTIPRNAGDPATYQIRVFDPKNDSWSSGQSFQTDLNSRARCAWAGNRIFVLLESATEFVPKIYNPATDSWADGTKSALPSTLNLYSVTGAGERVLIYGSYSSGASFNLFKSYTLATNAWSDLATSGNAKGQYSHNSVWNGQLLISFGGARFYEYASFLGNVFNSAANTWSQMTTNGTPPRSDLILPKIIWTGQAAMVYGGWIEGDQSCVNRNTGFIYDFALNSWRQISTTNPPHNASCLGNGGQGGENVYWTGKEMYVSALYEFNGLPSADKDRLSRTSYLYDPKADRWSTLPLAPLQFKVGAGVWTSSNFVFLNDLGLQIYY